MRWKISDKSAFAILMRSPWWISAGIAFAVIVLALAFLPEAYRIPGVAMAFPFLVTGGISAWRQLRTPSVRRIDRTCEAVRAMSWNDFARAVEDAYRRDGFAVTKMHGNAADFALAKDGRTTLVSCKRWKAARTGIQELRDLRAAGSATDAQECIHIATGEISDNARQYAAANRIRLVGGPELTRLLPGIGSGRA